MIGRTLSHYRIVGQLGAGGMGVVYRAEDVRLGRAVALKFVSEDLENDQQAIQRLRSEARAASALNHGNICTIYDIGEEDGHPFIVMELMKGQNLRDRLASGPLKIHQLVDIGIEIADALHAAHSEGIVHRDIKPANIFLTDRGHVKILDFGLAKLTPQFGGTSTTGRAPDPTVAGVTLGTISYMSPEQAQGEELDGRTDLFSLGVVLYECTTGHHPFPGKASAVVLAAILDRAPVAPILLNPELPLHLQEVINNCLEKDRELRYQSAADLRADLKRVRRDIESGHSRAIDVASRGTSPAGAITPSAGSAVVSSRTDNAEATVRDSTRVSSRALWAGIAAVVIAVIAAVSYAVWQPAPALSPDASRVAALSDAAIHSRLELASASLEAKNYRAALAYAGQVLAIDPTHTAAAKIRDDARAMLARFDAAIADARQRVAARDGEGAARALETARALDPAAPSISEISSRLADLVRQRETVTQGARQSRVPAEPATAPRGGTPSGAARSEPPRDVRFLPPAAPPATSARAQIPPRTEAPPIVPVPPAPAPVPPLAAPPAVPEVAAPSPKPAPAPLPTAQRPEREPPSAEQDDAEIRRVTATYTRAIERKDLALFRSIKPNLSREEEQRLQEGFRAVTSQRVNLTILSIDRRGDEASVVLRRRDTIQAGGRQHTTESQQTMQLARASGGWVIVDIR